MTPWVLGRVDREGTERWFCFPPAGGGASVFNSWRSRLPESVELCPVQLPGRENRIDEPMPDTLVELANQTARALLPLLRPPYVLFGHSFGGLLAYAVSRCLHELRHPLPRTLLISGARPPQLPAKNAYHVLADDELVEFLRTTKGLPEPLLGHESLVRRLLAVLRTDLRIAADYQPGPAEPLLCDTEVLAAEDDPVVPPAVMEGWRGYAGGSFRIRRAPGDHHAIYDPDGALFTAVMNAGRAHP
nr:alpha/beta fold hydrolase [Actinopolyspora biskrensis]